MARHLHLLPRRQPRIALAEVPVDLRIETPDLLGDVDAAVVRQVPQFLDLAFEFGDRAFKIQEMTHLT
ncbi:hypothetical protein D3C83_220080 [compost metagenome]